MATFDQQRERRGENEAKKKKRRQYQKRDVSMGVSVDMVMSKVVLY